MFKTDQGLLAPLAQAFPLQRDIVEMRLARGPFVANQLANYAHR
jgi:hypothetical protein